MLVEQEWGGQVCQPTQAEQPELQSKQFKAKSPEKTVNQCLFCQAMQRERSLWIWRLKN